MEHIKNIIFDLGGIFLNIDFGRTKKAFENLGVVNFDQLYTQHHASDLFQLLETGQITPEAFHKSFVQQSQVDMDYDQLVAAWNALLLDFPPERLAWLKAVSRKYKIFLFSNTNQIHYEAFKESFYDLTGEDFDSYFIKAYYSHIMGMRKPDPASYLYIVKEQGLKPEETLFVDDTYKNIEGALKAGLHAIHIAPPKTVTDLELLKD